ncbi:MAG: dienelactone hydrolase family protein [Longimicrobiaceae bacterium]
MTGTYRRGRPGVASLLPTLLTVAIGWGCGEPDAGRSDQERLDATAREHAGEGPAATGAVQEPRVRVAADTVVYGALGEQELIGYLARPAGSGGANLPGLIVIHEWWGLNDNVRAMTRRLAGEGYSVLAVDLFGGEVADDPRRARGLVEGVMSEPDTALLNLRAAADFLVERRAARVGILGWCFGGTWSWRGALAMPERIDAAVVYYGQIPISRDELEPLEVPLLGIFGAEDRSIPVTDVRRFQAALNELDKDAEVRVYGRAGHAFANPSGEAYRPGAAEDAWGRTLDFLERHLEHRR